MRQRLDLEVIPGTNHAGLGVALCGSCDSIHVGVIVLPYARTSYPSDNNDRSDDQAATLRFLPDGRLAVQVKLDHAGADKLLGQLTQLLAAVRQ